MTSEDSTEQFPAPNQSRPPSFMSDSAIERLLAAGLGRRAKIAAWTPPAPRSLQPLLADYEIISLVGRGGMGAVYLGIQRSLDRSVAIKILPSELAGSDPLFAARFRQEAKAMARLSHPHIVPVYDFGQTPDGMLYFVMEHVEGTDLQHILKSSGPLSPRKAAAIISQVCDALEYAHENGIIHRDIKPSNIMLDLHDQVKVADFGLAKERDADLRDAVTQSGEIMGTRAYMAPEQALGKTVDHRADIYSVGAMFYEMLTGEPPHGAIEPPSRKVEVDERLDSVVLKALAQDPERRYQHAGEVKSEITQITDHPPPQASPSSSFGKGSLFWLLAASTLITVFVMLRPVQRNIAGEGTPPSIEMPPGRRTLWEQRVREHAALLARQRTEPSTPLPPFDADTHRLIAERMLTLGGRPTLKLRDGQLLARISGQSLPADEWTVNLLDFEMPVHGKPVLTRDELLFMLHLPELEGLITYSIRPQIDAQVMRALGAHTGLRWVGISGVKIQDGWLRELAACSRLESLCLQSCGVSDAGLAHLQHLTNLRHLNVANTTVTGASIANMACAPELLHLQFGLKGIHAGEGLRHILRNCREALSIHVDGLIEAHDLDAITNLTKLESLSFGLSKVHFSWLDALARTRHPRVLMLVNCQLDDDAWKSLKKLDHLHTLRFIGDVWPEAATAALRSMRSLQQLELMDKARSLAPQVRAAVPGLVVVTN